MIVAGLTILKNVEKPVHACYHVLIAKQMAIKINNEQKWIFYWQFSRAIKSLQQNGKH